MKASPISIAGVFSYLSCGAEGLPPEAEEPAEPPSESHWRPCLLKQISLRSGRKWSSHQLAFPRLTVFNRVELFLHFFLLVSSLHPSIQSHVPSLSCFYFPSLCFLTLRPDGLDFHLELIRTWLDSSAGWMTAWLVDWFTCWMILGERISG